MRYEYYYNNVPGEGQSRNNLIYTSLMSTDKKVFVQWYHNDTEYHQGKNEVVDPELMDEKWRREVHYLTLMAARHPDLVPKIIDIDYTQRKIFLEVDGLDFWNRANCTTENYDSVLPNWQEQMLNIIQAHHKEDMYKFSMHPSSYFVVDGQLKSINYFFCYGKNEGAISIADHLSHIHSNRQEKMREHTERMGIDWFTPQPLDLLENLCWDTFRSNYPTEFIEKAKCIK